MRRAVYWTIGVIVAGLIVLRVVQFLRPEKEKALEEVPIEVLVEQVKRGSMTSTLSFTGNIAGEEQVNVHPIEETGRLLEYLVKEGDMVSKGSAIALVDRSIEGMEFKPARIVSPISGVVGVLYLDKGAMVSPQMPVAMIVDLDKVKVEIQVVERDMSKVRTGQKAKVRVDTYPDTSFVGKLVRLSPVMDPLSKTTKGEIVVDNPRRLLKPGGFARLDLVIEEHEQVLLVPDRAILERAGKEIVLLAEGDRAREVEVETGISQGDRTEIVGGLKEGDWVIALGNYGLRDGAKIKTVSGEE